ncbi:alpha/beta fold hydrolase [Nonomuraea sp. NN258]|uniref:alpha/beta fold hydrolase n=1 Tax=Nonomuraea antri TaxID=2730852 RepID=UPI00156A01E7|nr:alpha/beta hydrolase [Nonomuraea antri]NRQ35703.1 alpha/beta fold hydrolase [Nonomuraea antri]
MTALVLAATAPTPSWSSTRGDRQVTVAATSQAVPAPGLLWRDCGDRLQCSRLSVPVDWRRPRGPRTGVDVARMPAQHPGRRIGTLVANLGSGSSIQAVRAQPDLVGELTRWFDVVIMDGRGLGDRGSPVLVGCAQAAPDPARPQLAPGRAAWRRHARDNAAYDRSCRTAAGTAFAGLTSRQSAHDLDAVRSALGEPRLRYFGNSYGAVYGQAYLELFPARVHRMYLEGVPDHTEPDLGRRLLTRAVAVERQFTRFRDWCTRTLGCPLGDQDAVEVFDRLRRRTPLSAGPGRGVSGRGLAVAVAAGLNQPKWPQLARALAQAREGDAKGLAALAGPEPVTPPGTVERVTYCHDFLPDVPAYRQLTAIEARLRQSAPRVGWTAGRQVIAQCAGVAPGPVWRPHVPVIGQVPPVLIGIGQLDLDTPAAGAAHAAGRVPGAAVLWHGDGHDAYLRQGTGRLRATCLRTRVHDYLVNGMLPAPGTTCRGELGAGMGR